MSYFQSIDSSLGSRVVGPEKTISGKVHETLTGASAKAKEVDEQKGISKIATDVRHTPKPSFSVSHPRIVLRQSPGTSPWPKSVSILISFPSTQLSNSRRHAFYTSTTKQVRDIHEEARRIAHHHKTTIPTDVESQSEKTPPTEAESSKPA